MTTTTTTTSSTSSSTGSSTTGPIFDTVVSPPHDHCDADNVLWESLLETDDIQVTTTTTTPVVVINDDDDSVVAVPTTLHPNHPTTTTTATANPGLRKRRQRPTSDPTTKQQQQPPVVSKNGQAHHDRHHGTPSSTKNKEDHKRRNPSSSSTPRTKSQPRRQRRRQPTTRCSSSSLLGSFVKYWCLEEFQERLWRCSSSSNNNNDNSSNSSNGIWLRFYHVGMWTSLGVATVAQVVEFLGTYWMISIIWYPERWTTGLMVFLGGVGILWIMMMMMMMMMMVPTSTTRTRYRMTRIIMAGYLFLFPTLVELRTLQWLTSFIVPTTTTITTTPVGKQVAYLFVPSMVYWLLVRFDTQHSIFGVGHNNATNPKTTTTTKLVSDAAKQSTEPWSWTHHRIFGGWCPNYCYKRTGYYILYGLALYHLCLRRTTSNFAEQRHLPNLMANFFFTTALLFYRCRSASLNAGSRSSSLDVSIRTIRTALRRTLLDIVPPQHPTRSKKDERMNDPQLLYLALLQWIADHWDVVSTSVHPTTTSSSSSKSPTNRSVPKADVSAHDSSRQQHRTTATGGLPTKVTELDHLSSMGSPKASNATRISPDMRPEPPSQSTPHFTGYSRNSSTGGDYPYQRQSNHWTTGRQDGMQDLRATLATLDLDERAKPAVLAYRQVVQEFPPTYLVAVLLGLYRRSPTIQLLLFHGLVYLRGGNTFPYARIGLLLPFVYMEMIRIYLWKMSCHCLSNHQKGVNSSWLPNIEPMSILFMDENYVATRQLPRFIIVWQNVNTSVEIAELSITVTRCVQTTTVANDLMSNLVTLVHLAYEILQHGWIHGITIIGKELVHLHTTGTDPTTLWHGASSPAGASYTSATISLMRNIDIIRRNINVLSEDERDNIGKIVAPIIGFLALIVGQGWLWGRPNDDAAIHCTNETTASTVVIVELTDDDDIAAFDHPVTKANESCAGTQKLDKSDGKQTFTANTPVTTEMRNPPLSEQPTMNEDVVTCSTDVADNEECELPIEPAQIELIHDDVTSKPWHQNSMTGCEQTIKKTDIEMMNSIVTSNEMSDAKIDATVDGDHSVDTKDNGAAAVSIEDISEMMELLSQCDEYELLDTNARNAILVKLAEFKQDGNESLREWFGTIRTNLRSLLYAREVMQTNLRCLLMSTEVIETSETSVAVNSDPEEATPANTISLPSRDDTNRSGSESLPNDSIDHLELDGDSGGGALYVSSQENDEMIRDKSTGNTNEAVAIQSALSWPVLDDDDDDEFQPMEEVSNVEHLLHVEPTNSIDETVEKCMNVEEEENIWLKIGSGVAILGGIVGGVVMMNAVQNRHHDPQKKR